MLITIKCHFKYISRNQARGTIKTQNPRPDNYVK